MTYAGRTVKNGYVATTMHGGKWYYIEPVEGNPPVDKVRDAIKLAAFKKYGLSFPIVRGAWGYEIDQYEKLAVDFSRGQG